MPVSVNGFEIPQDAIQREAERMQSEVAQQFPWLDLTAQKLQAEDMAKERIIEHRVLFEKAQTAIQNLTTEEIDKEFEQVAKRYGGRKGFLKKFHLQESQISGVKKEIEEDLKFRRYLDSLKRNLDTPTEEDVSCFFENNKKRFTTPDQYKAAHIVFHTNEGQDPEEAKHKAEDALNRLEKGESFEKLADEISDCPGKGGDLGWFPEGQMVEEFEQVVFNLGKGERSGVFQTPFGYHIARLDDHKPGELKPFNEVKGAIHQQMVAERQKAFLDETIDQLKAKATIVR